MYEKERELAITVVAEAAGLGRAVQDQIAADAEAVTKGDRSPVTVADLAIQAVVSTRLAAAYGERSSIARCATSCARPSMIAPAAASACACSGPHSGEVASASSRGSTAQRLSMPAETIAMASRASSAS